MYHPAALKYHLSLTVSRFKLEATAFFAFQFDHFCAHPLLDDVALDVSFEKQFQGQIKLPCDHQFLFVVAGADFRFLFPAANFLFFEVCVSSLLFPTC